MLELVPEQIIDAQLMADKPFLPNFSKAGTGKTHTTLQAFKLANHDTNIIFCPIIARGWWAKQIEEWLGEEVNVLKTGNSPLGGRYMVTTYGIARNKHAELYEYLRRENFGAAMDESHNVRNPDAKQTQALYGLDDDMRSGILKHASSAWPLSGTPIFAYANDLWTQAGIMHRKVWASHGIHSYDQFKNTFTWAKRRQFHPNMPPVMKVSGNRGEQYLNKVLYEEIGALRRSTISGLKDVAIRELSVPVKMDRETRKLMNNITADDLQKMLNDPDSLVAKVWHTLGTLKVPTIGEYVTDSARTEPVLLGCWHRDVMQAYEDFLTAHGINCIQVHGSTPEAQLERIQNQFNSGDLPVLIGQMQKMGSSWNLQELCKHVVIAETHPSPAIVEQFYKRVYRRGQRSSCVVDMFIADSSLDQGLNSLRLRKQDSAEKITG